MGHTLHSTLAISIQLTSWHPDNHLASLPKHEAIYKAIAARDPQAALEATRTLLIDSRKDFDYKKRLPTTGKKAKAAPKARKARATKRKIKSVT